MDAQGKDLSNCMSRYWATFARTGVPGDNALTEWQTFDPGNPMWMKLGPEVGMKEIDRREKYSILNRHLRRNFASLALSDTGS